MVISDGNPYGQSLLLAFINLTEPCVSYHSDLIYSSFTLE